MNRTDYPEIEIYRYHYMGILACKGNANLTAVSESIEKTVPAGHTELTHLVRAGQERRQEIAAQKETHDMENKS